MGERNPRSPSQLYLCCFEGTYRASFLPGGNREIYIFDFTGDCNYGGAMVQRAAQCNTGGYTVTDSVTRPTHSAWSKISRFLADDDTGTESGCFACYHGMPLLKLQRTAIPVALWAPSVAWPFFTMPRSVMQPPFWETDSETGGYNQSTLMLYSLILMFRTPHPPGLYFLMNQPAHNEKNRQKKKRRQ